MPSLPDRIGPLPDQGVPGLRWVCLCRLVEIPWAGRVRALPFLTALAPSARCRAERGQRRETLTRRARQLLLCVRRWLPDQEPAVTAEPTPSPPCRASSDGRPWPRLLCWKIRSWSLVPRPARYAAADAGRPAGVPPLRGLTRPLAGANRTFLSPPLARTDGAVAARSGFKLYEIKIRAESDDGGWTAESSRGFQWDICSSDAAKRAKAG